MKTTRTYVIDTEILMKFEKKYPKGERGRKIEQLIVTDINYISDGKSVEDLEKQKREIKENLEKERVKFELIEKNLVLQKQKEEEKNNYLINKDRRQEEYINKLFNSCVYCRQEIEEGQRERTTVQFKINGREFRGHRACNLDNMERIKQVKEHFESLIESIDNDTFDIDKQEEIEKENVRKDL